MSSQVDPAMCIDDLEPGASPGSGHRILISIPTGFHLRQVVQMQGQLTALLKLEPRLQGLKPSARVGQVLDGSEPGNFGQGDTDR